MDPTFTLFLCGLLVVVCAGLWKQRRELQRERFIREAELPRGLFEGLRKKRPALSLKDCQLVAQGLRQFFLAHLKSGHGQVSMPSQLADELWHEFILHTRNYDAFCRRAFGRFLHHTPAVALGADAGQRSNAGLRRVWWYCCRLENINPREPARLPLLFALDTKFEVADGFHYLADCRGVQRKAGAASDAGSWATVIHCGTDFADRSVDGSIDGFGDNKRVGGSGSDGMDGDGGDGGGCGS